MKIAQLRTIFRWQRRKKRCSFSFLFVCCARLKPNAVEWTKFISAKFSLFFVVALNSFIFSLNLSHLVPRATEYLGSAHKRLFILCFIWNYMWFRDKITRNTTKKTDSLITICKQFRIYTVAISSNLYVCRMCMNIHLLLTLFTDLVPYGRRPFPTWITIFFILPSCLFLVYLVPSCTSSLFPEYFMHFAGHIQRLFCFKGYFLFYIRCTAKLQLNRHWTKEIRKKNANLSVQNSALLTILYNFAWFLVLFVSFACSFILVLFLIWFYLHITCVCVFFKGHQNEIRFGFEFFFSFIQTPL